MQPADGDLGPPPGGEVFLGQTVRFPLRLSLFRVESDVRNAGVFPSSPQGVPMRKPAESSADLLDRARRGDTDSLEQLVIRQIPQLRAWAHGRVPSAARGHMDTDDIVQEALIRLLSVIDSFEARGEAHFAAYLRTTAKHLLTDRYRSEGQRTVEPFDSADHPRPAAGDGHAGSMLRRFGKELERLSAEDAFIVVARLQLGCTYPEISEVTGKQVDTVRIRFDRTLKKLLTRVSAP